MQCCCRFASTLALGHPGPNPAATSSSSTCSHLHLPMLYNRTQHCLRVFNPHVPDSTENDQLDPRRAKAMSAPVLAVCAQGAVMQCCMHCCDGRRARLRRHSAQEGEGLRSCRVHGLPQTGGELAVAWVLAAARPCRPAALSAHIEPALPCLQPWLLPCLRLWVHTSLRQCTRMLQGLFKARTETVALALGLPAAQ